MNDELQTSLKVRYPELFELQGEDFPIKRWGIEVGDGWYWIIDAILSIAHSYVLQGEGPLTLSDCKEKCGTLRVSFRGNVDDRLRGACDAADAISARTCMRCGRPGERRNHRAITLCNECASEDERKFSDRSSP